MRMFPDYAGTVLWYGGGPVDYEEAHLPAGLVAYLEAWEASYYAGLDEAMEWRSRDLELGLCGLGRRACPSSGRGSGECLRDPRRWWQGAL